jgi:hypothetical protein
VIVAAAAAAVVVAGGAISAVLLTGGSGGNQDGTGERGVTSGSYTASGPWRLQVDDQVEGDDSGCTITLKNTHSGQQTALAEGVYGTSQYQISQAGSFRWTTNNSGCLVAAEAGSGSDKLPLSWSPGGDSDAFTASSQVQVQVTDYNGSPDCLITLRDPANGQPVAFKTVTRGKGSDTVVLDASGHPTAYLSNVGCTVRVTRAPTSPT